MPQHKRLKSLAAQKKALVVQADRYRREIGETRTELEDRWSRQNTRWWLLAATAARNMVFSQFSSKWERGLAAVFSTWKSFTR